MQQLSKRYAEHKSHAKYRNSYLANAINKYGIENFSKEKIADAVSFMHMVFLEGFYIKYFKSNQPQYGYNLTIDTFGNGLEFISESTRQKMSQSSFDKEFKSKNGYRGIKYSCDSGHIKKPWSASIVYKGKRYYKRYRRVSLLHGK